MDDADLERAIRAWIRSMIEVIDELDELLAPVPSRPRRARKKAVQRAWAGTLAGNDLCRSLRMVSDLVGRQGLEP